MKKLNLIWLTLAFLAGSLLFASFTSTKANRTNSSLPDTIRIESGFVAGVKNTEGNITVFKGIPFAAPPIGELRWKAPQPVEPWTGVKRCEAFGPSPMQPSPAPFSMWSEEFLIPKEPISEDCLYLNVWTGAQSKKRRPARAGVDLWWWL